MNAINFNSLCRTPAWINVLGDILIYLKLILIYESNFSFLVLEYAVNSNHSILDALGTGICRLYFLMRWHIMREIISMDTPLD